MLSVMSAQADSSLPGEGDGTLSSQRGAALKEAARLSGMDDAHHHLTSDVNGLRFHFRISDRCGVEDDYEARILPASGAPDRGWRARTTHFVPDRPGRTVRESKRSAAGWQAVIATNVGDFPDRSAAFIPAFRRALDHCLSAPPPMRGNAVTCSRAEWLSLKKKAQSACSGDSCSELARDLKEHVFCDGDEPDTRENRERCDSRMMVRENPQRCQRIGPGRFRINVDCYGWELSFDGATISSLQSTGNCD